MCFSLSATVLEVEHWHVSQTLSPENTFNTVSPLINREAITNCMGTQRKRMNGHKWPNDLVCSLGRLAVLSHTTSRLRLGRAKGCSPHRSAQYGQDASRHHARSERSDQVRARIAMSSTLNTDERRCDQVQKAVVRNALGYIRLRSFNQLLLDHAIVGIVARVASSSWVRRMNDKTILSYVDSKPQDGVSLALYVNMRGETLFCICDWVVEGFKKALRKEASIRCSIPSSKAAGVNLVRAPALKKSGHSEQLGRFQLETAWRGWFLTQTICASYPCDSVLSHSR